jgi:flagellar hook protein FlgE
MLTSLNSGVSGLQQFQERLDVIGNNIANVSTTGFKGADVDFAETFSQTLQGAGGNSMQIGTGVATAAITNTFSQGSLATTGNATDLAINGAGFFTVRDAVSGATYATRDGSFKLDASGYLVNNQGLRLQGFSDSALSARGDIQIDATGAPAGAAAGATVSSFSIGSDGKVTARLSDGTSFVRGQVLLQNFQNPAALVKEGNNLYSGLALAGPLAQTTAPSTSGLGNLQSGALEMSNVDLTTEFADLITTQRGFQANARVITTSDEVLQELVNLKR